MCEQGGRAHTPRPSRSYSLRAGPESVLTAVGITYLAHAQPGQVRLASARALQPSIGEVVVNAPSSQLEDTAAFARRVLQGFSTRVGSAGHGEVGDEWVHVPGWGSACARRMAYATASDDETMPETVHRYLRLGFTVGPRVWHMVADERVAAYDGLARYVLGECEHTRQFVRFSHMADGSFAASFSARANTVPLVATHFAARMRTERFFIVDPKHQVAAFHRAGERSCQVVRIDQAIAQDLASRRDVADDEPYVRALWKRFYQGTTTPGRDKSQRGYDLRTSWMPQRFWSDLTELAPQDDSASLQVPKRYRGDQPQRFVLPTASPAQSS